MSCCVFALNSPVWPSVWRRKTALKSTSLEPRARLFYRIFSLTRAGKRTPHPPPPPQNQSWVSCFNHSNSLSVRPTHVRPSGNGSGNSFGPKFVGGFKPRSNSRHFTSCFRFFFSFCCRPGFFPGLFPAGPKFFLLRLAAFEPRNYVFGKLINFWALSSGVVLCAVKCEQECSSVALSCRVNLAAN